MARAERKALIAQLEGLRESKVLAYVTSDRAPVPGQMSDDALRPMYDHLRGLGRIPKLDLFVYSLGGAIDTPWRIVNALRQLCDEWNILIPLRANSAATLLALGADEIVLGPQGELGPIDPLLNFQREGRQEQVNVEDVMAYLKLIQTRVGLSDQSALSQAVSTLAGRLDAVSLGSVYRTHSHIRDVARRILLSRKTPANEQTLASIIETLAERVYAHGHAIGFRDAKAIGLPLSEPSAEVEGIMWALFCDFEEEMKSRSPVDPVWAVNSQDRYQEESTIVFVESQAMGHTYTGILDVKANRTMPGSLNISVNFNLQVPPGFDPAQAQALQQLLQAVQAQLGQQAQQAVMEALRQNAPLAGAEIGFRNGRWLKRD